MHHHPRLHPHIVTDLKHVNTCFRQPSGSEAIEFGYPFKQTLNQLRLCQHTFKQSLHSHQLPCVLVDVSRETCHKVAFFVPRLDCCLRMFVAFGASYVSERLGFNFGDGLGILKREDIAPKVVVAGRYCHRPINLVNDESVGRHLFQPLASIGQFVW